jgi:bacterioferritin
MLVMRIIQLGGTPVLKPEDWYRMTNCGYAAPEDASIKPVLKQNIHGEQCAIGVYSHLIALVKDKDEVTYNIVRQILQDEVEHEEDLQALLEDLELMLQRA